MKDVIENNYYTIKKDVTKIVEIEMERIMKDPKLSKLVKKWLGHSLLNFNDLYIIDLHL